MNTKYNPQDHKAGAFEIKDGKAVQLKPAGEYKTKVSSCCGAPCSMTEYGICPDCHEHCSFEDLEEGEE